MIASLQYISVHYMYLDMLLLQKIHILGYAIGLQGLKRLIHPPAERLHWIQREEWRGPQRQHALCTATRQDF